MDLKLESPFTYIIFGASGDLAKLELFPAVYAIAAQRRLPDEYRIIGFARTEKSQSEFKQEFEKSIREHGKVPVEKSVLDSLLAHVEYISGEYDNEEDYQRLFEKVDTAHPIITHLSIPPFVFEDVVRNLARKKRDDMDMRLIFEKPFGQDLRSAEYLFYFALNHFPAESLFLLDHYLGKTAVRSLVEMRRNNRIFNLILQGGEIDNIQISALESQDINRRFGFFDSVGTIKDFVQSHLLQLAALTTMTLPLSQTPAGFQREKNNILSALTFDPKPENIVLGQYASYRTAHEKLKNSQTETFVALKIGIDQESWYNVPIYIRSGKSLSKKQTYIMVEFKKLAFEDTCNEPNRLIIELHPQEQVSLTLFNSKSKTTQNESLALTDSLACEGDDCLPEHALFLMDALRGENMFFLSFQEVIASWKLIDAVTGFIANEHIQPEIYPDGSQGPDAAQKLIENDGRKWFSLK